MSMFNENTTHDEIGNWLLSRGLETSNNSASDEVREVKMRLNSVYGKSAQMSHEGVFDFYRGRIDSAPNYGFKAGHEILNTVIRTAFWDSFLTENEYANIITLCERAHIKMMEQNWKESWKDEG